MPELDYAGIVAANEEDFIPPQVEVTVDGIDQHLWRCDKDIECVLEQGDCWVQFDSHDVILAALGI